MTDRELLELAAKAAGIKYTIKDGLFVAHGNKNEPPIPWNPLDDDGDALRLAVDLDIGVQHISEPGPDFGAEAWIRHDRHFAKRVVDSNNFHSATRRAIVRAAAKMGRVRND